MSYGSAPVHDSPPGHLENLKAVRARDDLFQRLVADGEPDGIDGDRRRPFAGGTFGAGFDG